MGDKKRDCVKQGVCGAGTISATEMAEAMLPTQHPKENGAGVSVCPAVQLNR